MALGCAAAAILHARIKCGRIALTGRSRVPVPRGSLEVIEYSPRQPASDAVALNYPIGSEDLWSRLQEKRRTLTSCAVALAVLAMHIAVIAPVIWAGGGSKEQQEPRYRGETALQWVILDESPRTASVTPASLSLPRLVSIGVSDDLAAPSVTPPAPASKDPNAESEEQSSLGALYGRYVGQIRARIDRAWIRPRTAIGAPIFNCQVQIDQDRVGQVGDVTLVQCNGDTRWRLSLVRAIEGASPLPTPPNPAVFARHIVLEFRAMAYAPGVPGGLYEPPTAAAEHAGVLGAAQSQNAFQALRQAITSSHSDRALALRIEGAQVEVEPNR